MWLCERERSDLHVTDVPAQPQIAADGLSPRPRANEIQQIQGSACSAVLSHEAVAY